MKEQFRMFLWKARNAYYAEDNTTGARKVLGKDKKEAARQLHAMNEAFRVPAIGNQMARAYMLASDPNFGKRTWQEVLDTMTAQRQGDTRNRWLTVAKDKALKKLWPCPLIKTTSEQLLRAMHEGTVSTNVYLRRLHNFAVDMAWIPSPIIPRRAWPRYSHEERRAITLEEHRRIIERETNPERRAFYELCWQLGGSQTDMAMLCAENFNWLENILSYRRKKTDTPVLQSLSAEIKTILEDLPKSGPLFSYLRTVRSADRATEFKQRCKGLGIEGVTLHSYRYAWAERARRCAFPLRFAQEALGHNSKAVARAYASKAEVKIPSLAEHEAKFAEEQRTKVVSLAKATEVKTEEKKTETLSEAA